MQPAFMLIECMVVVAIILATAAWGWIGYTTFKGVSYNADRALIALLLQAASTKARCTQREQAITFTRTGDTSALCFNGQHYPLSEGHRFGALPDVYGPPSRPIDRIVNPIMLPHATLHAYPDGTIQSGTLYITDGRNQYAITTPVSAFSHIRFYCYKDKTWRRQV